MWHGQNDLRSLVEVGWIGQTILKPFTVRGEEPQGDECQFYIYLDRYSCPVGSVYSPIQKTTQVVPSIAQVTGRGDDRLRMSRPKNTSCFQFGRCLTCFTDPISPGLCPLFCVSLGPDDYILKVRVHMGPSWRALVF
jgi:hypothetical protein